MPTNRRIFSQDAAVSAAADSAQGLVLHLDANDEDSIENGGANTGAGSGTWFDIANHDLNVPLVDKASNLQLHLNASDTTSYSGSGTDWNDISGNSRNGTINGGVESTYATDIRGSFDFAENTGDFVNVTHHADIKPSSNGVTYELWITPEEISGTDTYLYTGPVSGGDSGYGLIYFRLESGVPNITGYNSSNSAVINTNTGTALTAGSLHHVVATVSNTTNPVTKLYQDGTLKVTHTGSGTLRTDTGDLLIVRYTSGNANDFNGLIHAVRVYNTVLTASEVAQNYRAGNFLSYDSIYDTDLQANFDAANYTSGAWVDSVNSNSGTVNNANFDKELGNFFDFNRSDDNENITVSDSASLSPTSALSIEVIVNPESFDNHQRIVWKDGSYGLYASASGLYTFFINSASNSATATLHETGKFKHIVGTYDGSNIKIYINGILKNTSGYSVAITDNANNFTIGGDGTTARYYDGQIGFVRLFSSALSPAQVAQNYLATKNDYPNTYHATIDGATFSATTPAYFDLDGSNDHIDTTFKNTALEEFTISAYIRFVTLPASNKYFINDTTNGNEYSATFLLGYLSASGNWIFYIGNGSSATNGTTSVSSGMEANHWTHIVFTCDGINDTVKYYKNGSLSSTMLDGTATHIGSFSNTGTMQIGRWAGVNNFHTDMDVGQFKIFNKTLSASEVLAEFNATKTPYPAADFT